MGCQTSHIECGGVVRLAHGNRRRRTPAPRPGMHGCYARAPTGVLTGKDNYEGCRRSPHLCTPNRDRPYKRLLRTHLTELERAFVDRRLKEEKSELARLIGERQAQPFAWPRFGNRACKPAPRKPVSVSDVPGDGTTRCA